VRIYLASDLHGSERAERMIREDLASLRPDVFVAAGDLTDFGPASRARELFADLPVPALAVPGNCDPPETVAVLEALGVGLHARKATVGGRTFVGIGGSNPTPFEMPFELTEEEIRDVLQRHIEPGAIIVSHPPPHGYVDVAHVGGHVGSTALRDVIEAHAPPLVLCGHIHEARGVARHGPTTIVNAGAANRGHRALIEIDGEVRVKLL